tara:strand:+ start:99 stop:311 length:213 start_codon:yes stop_codon:yes gene_type:complete
LADADVKRVEKEEENQEKANVEVPEKKVDAVVVVENQEKVVKENQKKEENQEEANVEDPEKEADAVEDVK